VIGPRRHFHEHSEVFLALLFLVEASVLAQKPVTKAQPQASSPLAAQPKTSPA